MAYSTSVFIYTQRQIVVLLSGYSARSWVPQYSKPLILHKGVDNSLQFQFLNQQQKPVNITDKEITCRVINYEGNVVLIKKALVLQLPATGIAVLNISPSELLSIDPQKCYYTLEIPVGAFDYPVYVDQNGGARGDLNIVNSILPSFLPSEPITIPTGQPFPNNNPSSNAATTAITYFTSSWSSNASPLLSIQAEFIAYYGNVQIQGSTIGVGDWYNIGSQYVYSNVTETKGYNVTGFHPYIQVQFVSNVGAVTNILVR